MPLVFSDVKIHEKTHKPRLAYHSQSFMGWVIYQRFTVLAFSVWNRNLFHLHHICGGLMLICSRLNALYELKRENKNQCVFWEARENEKQLLNLINECLRLKWLLNYGLHLPSDPFPRSWAQGKKCFSLLILSVIVYTSCECVCVYVRRWWFDPKVVDVSLHGVPPLTNTHLPIIFTNSQCGWEECAGRQWTKCTDDV